MGNGDIENIDVLVQGDAEFRAEVGEALSSFGPPVDTADVDAFVAALQSARQRDFRPVVTGSTLDPNDAALDIGTRMFDAMFQGATRARLDQAWIEAGRRHGLVRMRLQLDGAPELANLPWEIIFRRGDPDHVVFGQQPYIVRHGGGIDTVAPRAIDGPLRILVVASLPDDLNPLSAAEEYESVERALASLVEQGAVELGRLEQPTLQDLNRRLHEDWHVVHFVGHGGRDSDVGGFLAFCDEHHRSEKRDARAVGRVLGPPNDIRLVVLNACKTAGGPNETPLGGVANELMARGVPAVVAMQFPVSDDQALCFAEAFYTSLAGNDVIDEAVHYGRRAMFETPEWVTPVLFLRGAGDVFDLAAIAERVRRTKPAPSAATTPAEHVPSDVLLDDDGVLPRPWLLQSIREWLDGGGRVLGLQGVSGTGKSVMCAWLAGGIDVPASERDPADDPADRDSTDPAGRSSWHDDLAAIRELVSAVHFFSKSMIGASADPRSFVAEVGRQLMTARESGVATTSGSGTLDDLTREALGLDDLFERAIVRPLIDAAPTDPVLIVVDGLDEAEANARETIDGWMLRLAQLDLPIRLLITSSDPSRLGFLAGLRTPPTIVDLDGDAHREAIERDVGAYTDVQLDEVAIDGDEAARTALTRRIVAAADGSFLYVASIANHLRAVGPVDAATDLALPERIGQLYEQRLEELLDGQFGHAHGASWQEGWTRDVEPVAGLLAVAEAPVPEVALAVWLGLTRPRLLGLTSRFGTLIRRDGECLVLGHAMYAEFLVGGSAMAGHRFRVDELAAHARIVDTTLGYIDGGDLDRAEQFGGEYSLVHLVAHARVLIERGGRDGLLGQLVDVVTSRDYLTALERCCDDAVDVGRPARELADLLIATGQLHDVERVVRWLATAGDPAVRQGAFDVLCALGAADGRTAGRLIAALAAGSDASNAEIALRATVCLSSAEQAAVFSEVVRHGDEEKRCTAAYALYANALGSSPALIRDVLDALVADLPLHKVWALRHPLEFFTQVTVTHYINHCDDADVVQTTSDLWHRLLVDRLHLHKINRQPVAAVVSLVMAQYLSARVMAAVAGDRDGPIGDAVPEADAARRVITRLDPATDLGEVESDITAVLDSEIPLMRMLGGIALVVHHSHEPEVARPIVERIFDAGDARRRSWILMAHAVASTSTPSNWVEPLERMTDAIARMGAPAPDDGVLRDADLMFAPLAQAYAKAGGEMAVHRRLLADTDVDPDIARRCLWGIGVAGLHFPDQAFRELDQLVADHLVDRDAIVAPLALMAGLYPIRVRAWARQQFDEEQATRVGSATDLATTRGHLELLGHLNNSLNMALHHPRMRRRIGMTVFSLYLESSSRREWTRRYAMSGLELLRESDYELIRWTLPDEEQ